MKLTQDRLKELLIPDADGNFIRLIAAGGELAGVKAGCLGKNGYVRIKIDDKDYRAHQLMWFYHHGVWSPRLDHEDTDRANNRIGNLREANRSQNGANRSVTKNKKSGLPKGVGWSKHAKKFRAQIEINGKQIHLGYFNTVEEASAAYAKAAVQYFGEFARAS